MRGFINFIRQQGVIGLSIGFLIGGAASKMVTAFVNDLINPIIGIGLTKVGNLKELSIQVSGSKILIGDFISNVIDFLIIAAVVYFVFKGLGLEKIDRPKVVVIQEPKKKAEK